MTRSSTVTKPAVASPVAGMFVPVDAHRMLDTRTGLGGFSTLPAGGTITVKFAGVAPVPTGAQAVSYNVTVQSPSVTGTLSVYPGGTGFGGAVSLSFYAGASRALPITSKLGSGGDLTFRNNTRANLTLIADVLGYYTGGGTVTAAGGFVPTAATRIYDSRAGQPIAHAGTVQVQAAGRPGIPASGVSAVVLNVTVLPATAAGSLSLYAADKTFDGVVDEGYAAHTTQQSTQTVTLSPGGAFVVRNNGTAGTQVIADVLGYYLAGTPTTTGAFTPVTNRVFDSRLQATSAGPMSGTKSVRLAGLPVGPSDLADQVPESGVTAVLANVTVLTPPAAGSLSLYSSDTAYGGIISMGYAKGSSNQSTTPVAIGNDGRAWLRINGNPVNVVVDVQGYFSVFSTWQPGTVQAAEHGHGSIGDVACVGSSFCMELTGSGDTRIYDGSSWTVGQPVPSPKGMGAVSCASPSFCAAVGYALATWNGSTWTASSLPSPQFVQQVSCVSTTFCLAGGDGEVVYRWDGQAWTQLQAPSNTASTVQDVSCGSASFCLLLNTVGSVERYDGVSLASIPSPKTVGHINPATLSCPTASFCLLGDAAGRAYTYGAGGWTQTVPIDPGSDTTVFGTSCVAEDWCSVVTSGGRAYRFDGAAWSAPVVVASTSLEGLSCGAATFCVGWAGGLTEPIFQYNGTTWSDTQPLGWVQGTISSVSCPTPTSCVAVDQGGGETEWNGSSWSQPRLINPTRDSLQAVSCATTSFCLAADSRGNVLRFNGADWSAPSPVFSPAGINALQCPTPTFCMAIDSSGSAHRWNGADWSAGVSVSSKVLVGLSCPTDGVCFAGDETGNVFSFADGSWSSIPRPSGLTIGRGLSCSSPTYCLVIGFGHPGEQLPTAAAAAMHGSTFTPVGVSDVGLLSVRCLGTDDCIGETTEAGMIAFEKGRWTRSIVRLNNTVGPSACASESFCMVTSGGLTSAITR